MRPAWIETDLDAIEHNLQQIRGIVGPDVSIIAVVKSNAYGHGAVPVARHIASCGAEMLAVALVEEGAELRDGGIDTPILVLGATVPEEASVFVEHDICPTVTGTEFAAALADAAQQAGTTASCHVKLDTGMGRQGARADRAQEFGAALAELPSLDIAGVFSHFASSPNDRDFTLQQLDTFQQGVEAFERGLGHSVPMHHIANSGAIIRHPQTHLDAVRPGALVFGLADKGSGEYWDGCRQTMTVKAKTVCVKPLRPGETVGYGRTYMAEEDMTVAVLPIGYADGYDRKLSNRADVLVRGRRCPVVGRVSMDCTMIDVTDIGPIGVGEEAVLAGSQGDETITVGELARLCDTCVEETVSRMSRRLPRVFHTCKSPGG